jgi:hypothetical protein
MVVRRLIACFAIFALASPARAHKFDPVRSMRIQIQAGKIQALLSLAVPQGLLAQKLLAIPPGLVPGEKADEPVEKTLGKRAALEALRGLHVQIGAEAGPLQSAPFELMEAKARKNRSGGLESMALLRIQADLPSGAAILVLQAESGPALRATLAAADYKLELLEGVGRASADELALRPRPGRPCRVRLAPAPQSPAKP